MLSIQRRGRASLLVLFAMLACSSGLDDDEDASDVDESALVGNPIPAENAKPGSWSWRITKPSQQGEIEGYSPKPSVRQGERVPFAVRASRTATFTWNAYRLGHYGGAAAREVAHSTRSVLAGTQTPCPANRQTGLVECAWRTTLDLKTGSDWVAGVYLLRLTRDDGFQSYIPFFVRDRRSNQEVLVSIATGTWAAYNAWGGESLYADAQKITGTGRAFQVSFDKPHDRDSGAGQLLTYERNLVQWLESQGLDVKYATTEELDADAGLFFGPKVIIVPGHDEYWTGNIRNRMDAAVARGTSLLLFGANAAYWQVRLGPSGDGRARRIITAYKESALELDPVGRNSPNVTTRFRDLAVPRPENALFGVMFNDMWHHWGMPVVIKQVNHWVFAGTGLKSGDTLWQAAGYEADQLFPSNQPPNVELLASSPVFSFVSAVGLSQMVVRQQGSAIVFAAGGINFTRALTSGDMADARVQRIAANVLYRALGRPVPSSRPTFTSSVGPQIARFASSVNHIAGVRGSAADVDGPAGVGKFLAPTGVTPYPGGGLAVADPAAHKVKRVDRSGRIWTVSTSVDQPIGVVADASGTIYASEFRKRVVVAISPDGRTTILAGRPWQHGSLDAAGLQATFGRPAGMALSSRGLVVADMEAGTVRLINLTSASHPVTTLASGLKNPSGVAVAPNGTIYVVETGANRISAVRSDGSKQVIAGSGTLGYADGPPSKAKFMPYLGIAVLADGSLAVSDPGNYRIRRVPVNGGDVTTLAGTGRYGQHSGAGSTADVALPAGLWAGSDGTLYVAEAGNAAILWVKP